MFDQHDGRDHVGIFEGRDLAVGGRFEDTSCPFSLSLPLLLGPPFIFLRAF